MEISADTKSLAGALEQIQGAVDKKRTIPILSHALVEASATGLHLAATDLELGIRMFCPAPAREAPEALLPHSGRGGATGVCCLHQQRSEAPFLRRALPPEPHPHEIRLHGDSDYYQIPPEPVNWP